MKKYNDCQVVPFSRMRNLAIDIGRMARGKHTIRGLVEVDVTQPRQFIRAHKTATGETLSFTAFLIACVGRAVDENKYLHAYWNWRGQLVLFDDVDLTAPIEIETNGEKLLTGHVFRAVNKRTFREIHEEMRTAQSQPMDDESTRLLQWMTLLPAFIRQSFMRIMLKNPRLVKQYMGTVALTAVGMFAKGSGWGIGAPVHTLGITVGGIAEKPGVIDGRIEIREYLSLTLDFDHDIIDGAPAARFAQRLIELIESGYGLCER
jgi:pyruvate/2-oxoglutarate dehydrogenase complex dihydrolipoamide acyltransferase (E2) component